MTQSNQILHDLIKDLKEKNGALIKIIEEKDNELTKLRLEIDRLHQTVYNRPKYILP